MSRNKLMHERNIYRKAPDFTQLAIKYPEFRHVCTLDLNGSAVVDFKNPDTLRILTKCLLKRDFQLDVEIPAGKLVPTLPLRLNYILWIEDILLKFNIPRATGLDIGCGASCVYPLLGAKWRDWQMYGTDITEEITRSARENISRNELQEKIKVFHQDETEPIFLRVLEDLGHQDLTFCMCNPPFFDDTKDCPENRTGKRATPKNFPTGNSTELACSGGELVFIERIIEESIQVKSRVSFFTTMIGIKHHLASLVKRLKEKEITNFIETHFCQGNTTRWGLAWSFRDDLLLRRVPCINPNAGSDRKAVNFSLTNSSEESVKFIIEKLRKIFEELEVVIEILEESASRVNWIVRAQLNTWSHQRRKRRQMQRESENSSEASPERKRIRIEGKPILVAEVYLTPRESQVKLELVYLDGRLGRDGVHQILQYIMNNWKKDCGRTEESLKKS